MMNRYFAQGYRFSVEELAGEFTIQEQIGRGASCVVYRADFTDEHGNQIEHLLKEYNPSRFELYREENGVLCLEDEDDRVNFETGLRHFRLGYEKQLGIRRLSDLKNTTGNIQGIYHANGTQYIDMTCFSGQTYDKVREQSVYDLMRRMKALVQVIGNYHRAGFLHLDIKPENIFTIPETCEMVMLFDFDSVTEKSMIAGNGVLSYSKSWAAPEQLPPVKVKNICEATDLFAVGEMIFVALFGHHSERDERRSFAEYAFDYDAEIFKNMNPRVFPLLGDLLRHTICGLPGKRYQSADELLAALDEIIKLADPKEPYIGKHLPAVQDFFVGRDAELKEINTLFKNNRIVFLNGIGGIGKSELAKRYAHKHKDEYDSILFAPYVSDVNMLISDDTAVQISNFAPCPEEKPEDYCARKLRKLKELCDERTLIIVDNLDRMDDPDLSILLDLNCKLLITTRSDFSEYGYGKQLELDVLSSHEQIVEIFEKYYTKFLTWEEDAFVSEIIDIVGSHTMTVELLAKQMMAGRIKPAKMLEKLKEGGLGDSGKEKVRSGKDGKLSAQSTYAHLQTLFDLSDLTEQEIYVLSNLSLIPYTGIPDALFREWCKLEDRDTINDLVKEGWIREDIDKDYISMHPVVGDVVRETIVNADIFTMFIKAYQGYLKNRAYMESEYALRLPNESAINYHILHIVEKHSFATWEMSHLLTAIGGNYYVLHQLKLAERAFIQEHNISVTLSSELRRETINAQTSLALVRELIGAEQKDLEKIYDAIDLFQQAIQEFSSLNTEDYPDIYEEIATVYTYMGDAYYDLSDNETAINMYQNAIKCYESRSRSDADDYVGLGVIYSNMGNVVAEAEESVKCYLKALEFHKKAGYISRHIAITYYQLADIYSDINASVLDVNAALEYAHQANRILEEHYPDDLYMIGQVKCIMGKIYLQFSGDEHQKYAHTLLSEAQNLLAKFFPPDSDDITTINQLLDGIATALG